MKMHPSFSQLHWQRLSLDEVSFLAVYRNAPGWVALSFPETAGLMVPADAVIGAGIVEPYRLTARSISVCSMVDGREENDRAIETAIREKE